MAERGKVWLAVAGLIINDDEEWLVVKKRYGGLLGKWSLPAGFVDAGETADEAVMREVLEETGVVCTINGMVGLRTGVLHGSISDNMIVFLGHPANTTIIVQENELLDAKWMSPEQLLEDEHASIMIHELIRCKQREYQQLMDGRDPGHQFGYTAYKLFF